MTLYVNAKEVPLNLASLDPSVSLRLELARFFANDPNR